MIPRFKQPPLQEATEAPMFDFSGGENTRDDPAMVQDNQSVFMQNCRITLQKAAQSRLGTAQYGTTLVSDTTSTITGMFEYDDSNGVRLSVRTTWNGSSGKFQTLTNGTWTTLVGVTFTDGALPFFVTFRARTGSSVKSATATGGTNLTLITTGLTANQYIGYAISIVGGTGNGQKRLILLNDTTNITVHERWDTNPDATSQYQIHAVTNVCFVTNGVDSPFFYDNTNGTATILSSFTKFKGFAVYKDKLFGWVNDNIYWSTYGLGEDFPQLNYQQIYTSQGDPLTVLIPTDAWMMIFKERSTKKLVGSDLENFEIIPVDENIGCIAPHSAKEYQGTVYFLSARGVETTSGIKMSGIEVNQNNVITQIPVSNIIDPTVKEWKTTLRSVAYGEVFNNKYYIAVGATTSSVHKDGVWIFDLIFNAWTHDTGYTPNCLKTIYDSNDVASLYFGDSTATGKCWQLETGQTDNGNQIVFKLITKNHHYTDFSVVKEFEKFYYLFPSTDGNEYITVETSVDNEGFTIVDTFALGANNLILPVQLPAIFGGVGVTNYRRFVKKQGYFLQHKFTNSGTADQVRIIGHTGYVRNLSLI